MKFVSLGNWRHSNAERYLLGTEMFVEGTGTSLCVTDHCFSTLDGTEDGVCEKCEDSVLLQIDRE